MSLPKIWAVLPAAGIGSRMCSSVPKQYLHINEQTVTELTLQRLSKLNEISGAIVALHAEDSYWNRQNLPGSITVETVVGGHQRSESVLHALDYLFKHESPDCWVLVHDMARPCVRTQDIQKLINLCVQKNRGGILAVPVIDTLKKQNTETLPDIAETRPRSGLWQAQTPQFFPLIQLRDALLSAHRSGFEVTDESSAVEQVFNASPLLVKSHRDNIKITEPEDLQLARYFLEMQSKC